MSELDETLDKLQKTNREFTQALLDIVRPVDPKQFQIVGKESHAAGKNKV